MLGLLLWPFRELFRFGLIFTLLVAFTFVGEYVDERGLARHAAHKAARVWNWIGAH